MTINQDQLTFDEYIGQSTEDLVGEREVRHGDWDIRAVVSYNIKYQFRQSPNWDRLSASQVEALEMIAVKISRILCGDPDHVDHWDDIASYALLGKGGHR